MRASVFALAIPLVAALPRGQPIEDPYSITRILSQRKNSRVPTVATIRTEQNGKVTTKTITSGDGAEGSESFDINSIGQLLPGNLIDGPPEVSQATQVAASPPPAVEPLQRPTPPNVGSTAAATTPETHNTVAKPVTSTDAAPETDNVVEGDFIEIANKWRKHMGLEGSYTRSEILINHALKASQNSTTDKLNHSPPGLYAQVMAPMSRKHPNSVERPYVGGWLCEKPELVEMDGQQCSMYNVNEYEYDTKQHAEILSDEKFMYMGCAVANVVLTCSLSIDEPKSD